MLYQGHLFLIKIIYQHLLAHYKSTSMTSFLQMIESKMKLTIFPKVQVIQAIEVLTVS